MSQIVEFTTPVGRLVGGSVEKARTTDSKGQPRMHTQGPKAGQPKAPTYDFALAIAKIPGHTHWSQTEWGAKIYQAGAAAHPGFYQNPAFAWKITDGDSTVPNKSNKRPCDGEGYPGHWVVWFSSTVPPQLWNANGTERITTPGAIKTGYYAQVFANVKGNTGDSPGVYINHSMVALAGFGPEISSGPDVSEAKFGQGVALPPGASTVPVAAMPPMQAAAPVAAPAAYAPPPVALPPAQVAVVPNPAILPLPPAPAAAVVLPPPQRVMTAKAQGATYEQLIAAGWTEALLKQEQMML